MSLHVDTVSGKVYRMLALELVTLSYVGSTGHLELHGFH